MMQWGSILTVLILTGICVLSLLLNYQSATASEMLPVSIQANEMADYSADEVSVQNPVVNMEIIEAAIKDQDPTNVVERIENVLTNLQTAVPTVTPTPIFTDTPVPQNDQPEPPQEPQANPPQPTATPRPPHTATPSKTALPTGNTATATGTGTTAPTTVPTNTAEKTATATNNPQATPTATIKPSQTATELPTATNTATKIPPTATDTATRVPPTATDTATRVPPTATDTATKVPPTATATATEVPPTATNTATRIPPTATDTAKPTPTNVPPTATMTPTTWCSWPDRWKGFVENTYPRNRAVNVPRDVVVVIQFNQPMYEGDLFKNIRVSGTNVDYVMSYDPATYRLEINFLELLEPGGHIQVEVKRNVKNICMWRQYIEVDFQFTITED
jgi:hypothetical protein